MIETLARNLWAEITDERKTETPRDATHALEIVLDEIYLYFRSVPSYMTAEYDGVDINDMAAVIVNDIYGCPPADGARSGITLDGTS